MHNDSLTIRDHLRLKARNDRRMAPPSGVDLYSFGGYIHGVDSDGNRTVPVESLTVGEGSQSKTITYDTDIDSLVVE